MIDLFEEIVNDRSLECFNQGQAESSVFQGINPLTANPTK